jgi:hypothetical protein
VPEETRILDFGRDILEPIGPRAPRGRIFWRVIRARSEMLTQGERTWIKERAWVPEHVVPLMETISGGEAQLRGGFLLFHGPGWVIFVGYPLAPAQERGDLCQMILDVESSFRPYRMWFVGEEIPSILEKRCSERGSDRHFRLDLEGIGQSWEPAGRLGRSISKVRENLRVEVGGGFAPAHRELMADFFGRAHLPPRVKRLYEEVEDYLSSSTTGILLSAWHDKMGLASFSVLETWPERFSVYLLGCTSRERWASHSSDLLMAEMIRLSAKMGKEFMHLGLGVNRGIRRFKEKWGGYPWIPYEECGWRRRGSAMERLGWALWGKF